MISIKKRQFFVPTFIAALLWLAVNPCGLAQEMSAVTFAGKRYIICRVDPTARPLSLFWRDDSGTSFKTFQAVDRSLKAKGRKLVFAMNAGMYEVHGDFAPVGLYVQDARELRPLNLQSGYGNFFLRPNGVFAVTRAGARVIESSRYPEIRDSTILATQSGPMLVIDGRIHPAFRQESESRLFRNGVGVVTPQEVVFAISEEPVNFYEFATFFRDQLHCRNALFLDGTISSLYSLELHRNDQKIDLGTFIGVTAPEWKGARGRRSGFKAWPG